MTQETLSDHLDSTLKLLESLPQYSDERFCGHENFSNYLYLAPTAERLSIHIIENAGNPMLGIGDLSSHQQKLEFDILDFKPYFEDSLARKGVTSIAPCPRVWHCDRATKSYQESFMQGLAEIQSCRGILNALLQLRNWAFFPEERQDEKYRGHRVAASYLGVVLTYLETRFKTDKRMDDFFKWCRKNTRKLIPWLIKNKEVRSPPLAARPIHRNEAANYIRHFLKLSRDRKGICNQHAEMVVFLSLCLACGRKHSNYFDPTDILTISKNTIRTISFTPKPIPIRSSEDIRKPSKTSDAHDVLLLALSSDFLLDDALWPGDGSAPKSESQDLVYTCKSITIKNRDVLLGQALARAIELMGEFTLSYKGIENRLSEAYNAIGLSQSSGGISPRCFLFRPHHWDGVDTRKD